MFIQQSEPHIRISYDKLPYIRNPDPKDKHYTYHMDVEAIEVPDSWIPEMPYIEKIPAILEPDEIYPIDGSIIWHYIIQLYPQPETDEKINITFKNKEVAVAYLRALKDKREINLKSEFPEVFL